MSDHRSSQVSQNTAKRSDRLSPELKEFLHMLQEIEEHPDTCTGDDEKRPSAA